MRRPILLLAGLAVLLLGVSVARSQEDAADEKALHDRVEATQGRDRGAANAELARFLEKQSRWSEASSTWRQARKLRGDLADAEGEARTLLAFAEEVLASGEGATAVTAVFEDARVALRRARDAGSRSVEVAMGLARCAETAGDMETVLAELTGAAAAAPLDLRPARALVAAYTVAGRATEALSLCAKLSDAHPDDAELGLALAETVKAAGDDDLAVRGATRAIRARTEMPRAWLALWTVYSRKQRWGELADAALAIARDHPQSACAAHYTGLAMKDARRFDEALVWLEKAWTLQSNDHPARAAAARILFSEKHDRDASIRLCSQVIAADPANQDAYEVLYFLGVLFTKEGRPAASVPLFETIARARRQDLQAQANLANAYRFAGRYQDSESAYLASIEAFPNDAQLRNDYALLLDARGRTAEACKVFAAAHEVDPANNDSMENLGFLARARGDREEALRWFRMALDALLAKGGDGGKHRINVDDQRWPLPAVPRAR